MQLPPAPLSQAAWVVFAQEEAGRKAVDVVGGNLLAVRGRHTAEASAVTNTSTLAAEWLQASVDQMGKSWQGCCHEARVKDIRVTDCPAGLEKRRKQQETSV